MIRKIRTQEEIAKEKRRNQIIIGVVMIGLLVLSTAGFSLMSSDNEDSEDYVEENGYQFYRENGMWNILYGEKVMRFTYLPSEVGNVSTEVVKGSFDIAPYVNEPVYFVDSGQVASEIVVNLGDYFLRYQEACLDVNETECVGDLPVKDCMSNLIIYGGYEEEGETKVVREGGCVYIYGDPVKGADAFLYKTLGII